MKQRKVMCLTNRQEASSHCQQELTQAICLSHVESLNGVDWQVFTGLTVAAVSFLFFPQVRSGTIRWQHCVVASLLYDCKETWKSLNWRVSLWHLCLVHLLIVIIVITTKYINISLFCFYNVSVFLLYI